MTTFSVSFPNSAAAGSNATNVLRSIEAAASHWAQYLQGYGTIQIGVTIANLEGLTIATGGSDYYRSGSLFESVPLTEIRTGADRNGSAFDIDIEINASDIADMFYDPSSSQAVPSGRIDAVTVFEHEIGHGLGLLYYSPTAYSGFTQVVDGKGYFTGPNAQAVFGGRVPLAEGFGHLDVSDLMNPTIPTATRRGVSALDLAILQDIGAPVATERADLVSLDSQNDTFFAYGGNDTVSGLGGNDVLFGNLGNDVLFGNLGNDTLYGGQGNDTVFGGQNDDAVLGNLGDDVVLGNLGNDGVFGGQGNDTLFGGQGNDLLSGDLGNDVLSGDLGADRYLFGAGSGADLILGFSQGQGDRLDFAGQTYTLGSAGNGDALLSLSGGGTVQLAGVTAAGLGAGFLV